MAYDESLSFIQFMPTRVVFGRGAHRDVRVEAENLGCRRAILVTDKVLRKSTDLVARVEKALGEMCVAIYDRVEPDSGVHLVDEAAELGREKEADCVVSVGGGSAIDTAKGLAMLLKEGGKLGDYHGFQFLTRRQTPHVSIPTTAGTGSEVTYVAVIKDHEQKRKMLVGDYHIIPDVAILDPEMTAGLPKFLTAATGMDALSHAVEAVHSMQAQPLSDALALHTVRLIRKHLPASVENGSDMAARGQMLIAACLGGAAFSNAQVGLVHAIAHSVGARFGVHHGLANSIAMPHCIRFNAQECAEKYRPLAEAFGLDVARKSDSEAAAALADAATELARSVGLPLRLRDAGVPEAGLEQIAELSISDGAIVYNPRFAMDASLVMEVLKAAW